MVKILYDVQLDKYHTFTLDSPYSTFKILSFFYEASFCEFPQVGAVDVPHEDGGSHDCLVDEASEDGCVLGADHHLEDVDEQCDEEGCRHSQGPNHLLGLLIGILVHLHRMLILVNYFGIEI